MKKIILLVAALTASYSVFAEDTSLCDTNLSKLAKYRAQHATTTGEPEYSQLRQLHEKAEQFKEKGDTKSCIASTDEALSIIARIDNR